MRINVLTFFPRRMVAEGKVVLLKSDWFCWNKKNGQQKKKIIRMKKEKKILGDFYVYTVSRILD